MKAPILPAACASTISAVSVPPRNVSHLMRDCPTVCRLDELQLLWVDLGQTFDQVDLLQRDLDGVLVLGPARCIRYQQL
jgi:hypothetical protein